LQGALAGRAPTELPQPLLEDPCGEALFGILVEGLADRFEPALCEVYARLFSHAVARVVEGVDGASLAARYERVRRPRPVAGEPHGIFVLSRVTLGADVAVTSVLLDAAKRRFPRAQVVFVGPRKNYELFAGDAHVHHLEVDYRRGGLRQRLTVWEDLKRLLAAPDGVVIDPDSRLTQLGLLPVCAEERCHLFDSRAYGGASGRNLPELAAAWALETFGVHGAKPYIALGDRAARRGEHIAVSLGVGENQAKRIPDPFEEELLRLLASTGAPLWIDKGAGGEEAERVERAVERAGADATATLFEGPFAGFAAIIAGSRLYVGYDSAGQHVAAAAGVPLISVFAGFPAPRMFERWRPVGENCQVIRVDRLDVGKILSKVRSALVG
jgi:ADP-heptose:LPS heptosyltransferase